MYSKLPSLRYLVDYPTVLQVSDIATSRQIPLYVFYVAKPVTYSKIEFVAFDSALQYMA